jgi:hypothetical protein
MKRLVLYVCVFAAVGASLPAQTAANFVTANVGGTAVTITGYKGTVKAVVIPSKINGRSVTSIESNAFSGNQLTSVTIGENVSLGVWGDYIFDDGLDGFYSYSKYKGPGRTRYLTGSGATGRGSGQAVVGEERAVYGRERAADE